MYVLVVDDHFEIARGIALWLRRVVERVDFEQSPARVLERLRDGCRYDVIVCDLTMPEMGGLELFDLVVGEFPAVRDSFVFMSAAPDAAERVRPAGRPLVRKPVGGEELLALVRARTRPPPT
jgi:CheY-like chemotaxis protein